ncbi:penicillin acylase family protein [Streptomyces sp. NPDC049687]|uniref:penicillin acylase family protein n=1 Tax=Streptomyces sp. NPDC049687 TaxID=3365596 RepID=UPI0037B1CC42
MTSYPRARAGADGPGGAALRRDARGVPVIVARDREEAAFELGRALGQDRLFQLDLFRRRATGRLAELFGPGSVAHDTAQRTLGIARAAHRHLARLPEPQRALLESHAAGIERGRAELAEPPLEFAILGAEPEPWSAADCVAVGLLLAQMLAGDGADLRMRDVMERTLPPAVCAFLLPERGPYATEPDGTANAPAPPPPPEELVALLRAARPPASGSGPVVGADESPFGSNAFAVAGHRTAHGGALLAGDMHLPLTAPSLLYRVSLRYPPHRIDGVVVPGVPVVVAGASERLAWSATRLTAAHADLVHLPAQDSPDRTDRIRTETVLVRGGDPVEVTVRESPWGPVYGRHGGVDVALRWRPLEDGGFDLGLLAVAESTDVTSACDAANRAAGPPLNLVVADSGGRIGWTVTGSFPRRQGPLRMVRPDRGERSWRDTVPPEALPRLLDPPSGMLVMANQLTDRHGGPGVLAANGFSARRARRAAEVLAAGTELTVADLLALQLDTDASFFAFYRDLVHEAVPADETSPSAALAEARAAVDLWDGTAGAGARGLGLLMLFRENLRETLFAAVLQSCRELDPGFRYVWHDHEEALRSLLAAPGDRCVPAPYVSRRAFLRAHLELAVRLHRHAAGGRPATEVRWGDLNRSAMHHPLSSSAPEAAALFDLPDVPLPGCAESVNAAHPGFGPAVRLVAGPGRPQDAVLQLPGGQSGDPRSVHYRDQFAAWLRGTAAPLAPQSATPAPAGGPTPQEAAP